VDFGSAITGQRSRQVYSDGAEDSGLLHLNRCWTDCAPVENGVTLDSTGCRIGRARGGVREIGRNFGDLNSGIDPWFVRNPELFGAVPTGRMAPMTAINFLFIGTGMLALTGKQPAKFAGPLGALAAVVGAIVLVGYWYGTPLLYGGHTIPVALSAACGFFYRESAS
jgi:hypothetical protein